MTKKLDDRDMNKIDGGALDLDRPMTGGSSGAVDLRPGGSASSGGTSGGSGSEDDLDQNYDNPNGPSQP